MYSILNKCLIHYSIYEKEEIFQNLAISPDAATPLMTLGVSKNEHSFCEIFCCQESVFKTFTKSDVRLSGALVWYSQAADDVRITTLEGFKFSNN